MIKLLINICINNKIYLLLKGRIFNVTSLDLDYINKNVSQYIKILGFNYSNKGSNEFNTFEFIDKTHGVKGLLPLQGYTHNNNYISNRIFETISIGYLIITNNLLAKQYFTSAIYDDDIEKLILKYIDILSNEEEWLRIMNQQLDEFLDKFYGYKNINYILNFLKETSSLNNNLLVFDTNIENKDYALWFTNKNYDSYKNDNYSIIQNNEEIRYSIINKNNYIIYHNNNYDIYLIEQLIQINNYVIYIDLYLENKDYIINICNKYNKTFVIKNEKL